jgi:proteasome assembly chaperone (PAC2) family protein
MKEIRKVDHSSLRKPLAVVGMPGVANVGRIAAVAMARGLKAVKLAEIFCTDSPPSAEVRKDGRPRIRHGQLYFSNTKESPHDTLIFTGDFQPSDNVGQYEYSDYIASICKQYRVELLISLAASVCGYVPVERKVWIAATSDELVNMFSKDNVVKVFKGATISGINGLAPVIASIGYGIGGACLLADTYPLLTEDPAASKCLLEVIKDKLQLPVPISILDKRIEKMKEELRRIEDELSKHPSKPSKLAKPPKPPEYFG